MTLKVPYTDNLTTNAKLPGQIAVDMKAIEHEDQQDDQALVEEIQDREDADKELDGKITAEAQARAETDKELDGKITQSEDRLNERITNYEKVTDERLDKIEKLLYGENPQLIEGDQGDHEPPNPHVVEITS